jgi:hypothetical protein
LHGSYRSREKRAWFALYHGPDGEEILYSGERFADHNVTIAEATDVRVQLRIVETATLTAQKGTDKLGVPSVVPVVIIIYLDWVHSYGIIRTCAERASPAAQTKSSRIIPFKNKNMYMRFKQHDIPIIRPIPSIYKKPANHNAGNYHAVPSKLSLTHQHMIISSLQRGLALISKAVHASLRGMSA